MHVLHAAVPCSGLFQTGGRDITKTTDESSKVIKLLSRIQHRKAPSSL